MDVAQQVENEQFTLWNGPAGRAWVETQELLDRVLEPFESLLMQAVSAASAGRLLDVGCGTGSTTLAAAWLLGASSRCTGIDISQPMIAAARDRAQRDGIAANFICADAQSYAFEPASFDMIISRFGVMFFDDFVRAFANLRGAARDGAELRFVAWRSAAENPFMTTAERAAAPLLPNIPPRKPGAPGQFAFADRDRIARILQDSGWSDAYIQPIDVACTLPEQELTRYITRLGPLGLALQDADDKTRAQIVEAIRPAFDRYVHGDEIRFTAACWEVSARA